jgi:hypothetical protein
MTSQSLEDMNAELLRLLEEQFLLDDPSNLELGVIKARSALEEALEDLQKMVSVSSSDPGTRKIKQKSKEVEALNHIINLSERINTAASSSSRISKELAVKLLPINQKLLELSGDRRHLESRIKDSCSAERQKDLQEGLRQIMLSTRQDLCRKAAILRVSSEDVRLLLLETTAHINRISEELSKFHADFPVGQLKKLASKDPFILPLVGTKLLSFAHIASHIIRRSSEFRTLFHDAERSCSSCKPAMEIVIADINREVLDYLKTRCTPLNMSPETFKAFILKSTSNYDSSTCSWAVQHFRKLCFWDYPPSQETDSRAVPFVASVQISLNVLKLVPDKKITVDRVDFDFERQKTENPFQVKALGSKLILKQPLYAWYIRQLEHILTAVIDTFSESKRFSSESCAWRRTSNELGLSLNSQYLACRKEPFSCKLHPDNATLWNVDFETMVATSTEFPYNHPGIELKREEIGWFYCHFGEWTHLHEHDMMIVEDQWYQRQCKPERFNVPAASSTRIGFEITKEADSMYFRFLNEPPECRKKLHRQILTSVEGQSIFSCVMWPEKLMQKSELSSSRQIPSSNDALGFFVDSLVSVEQKLARHHFSEKEKVCACSSSPKYNKIKSKNYHDCVMASNKDIGKSMAASVKYFMFSFHDRIRQKYKHSFDILSQLHKCYKCDACLPEHGPNKAQPSHDDDSVIADVELSDHSYVEPISPHDKHAGQISSEESHFSPAGLFSQLAGGFVSECQSVFNFIGSQFNTFFGSQASPCSFHPHNCVCEVAREIRRCHRSLNPSWGNCTVSDWARHDAHERIAKLFCAKRTKGYEESLEKFDAASMLTILVYCTDNSFKDINRHSCIGVKKVRNFVSHSSIENEQQVSCQDFYSSLCDIRRCLEELFMIILSKASGSEVESFQIWLQKRLVEVNKRLNDPCDEHFRALVPQPHRGRLIGPLSDRVQVLAHIETLRMARSEQVKPPALSHQATQEEKNQRYSRNSDYHDVCAYLKKNMDISCELLRLMEAASACSARPVTTKKDVN